MNEASIAAAPAGRPARERILIAARTLFYREGIRATGVERIAVGAITHSAPAMDIGLDIET